MKISVIALVFSLVGCIPGEKGPLSFSIKLQEEAKISPIISGIAKVNYENLEKHILIPKCIACHQGENAKPKNDPIHLTSYGKIVEDRFIPILKKGDPERSRLYLTVFRGEMPPKVPLEPEEVKFIKTWIELCAPENNGNACQVNDEPGDDEPGDDEPGDDEPSDH